VDAIIHTVGVSPTMADWRRIIDIDLVGTAVFLEAAGAHLNAGGCAVCLSSSSSYMCPPNAEIEQLLANPLAPDFFDSLKTLAPNPLEHPGLAYSYAKKALRQFVARQAPVWGKSGRRLVSISPGLIDTEMGQQEYKASENFEEMVCKVSLGRLGNPGEIASAALFLASEKASFITGCDLLVDGGLIAGLGLGGR
jgi:NAD(P)-dependent dehydrogenase (short-subunit alcohol dehydrogenase family)